MRNWTQWLMALAATVTLAACGGGGGSSGAVTGGSAAPPPTAAPTLSVTIVGASGSPTSNISIAAEQTVRAVLLTAQGGPVANQKVDFAVEGAQAIVSPASALTNAQGVASVRISPASITSSGAFNVLASTSFNGQPLTGQAAFSIQVVNLTLSPLALGATTLPSGGNTSITVDALAGGAPLREPVNVILRATCGRINDRDAVEGVPLSTDGNGRVSAVYRAVGITGELCKGRVGISASSTGTTERTASLDVAEPTPNALAFIGAGTPQIFVAGSGLQEQTTVRFRVLSGDVPIANVRVRFSLLVNPGGAGLGSVGNGNPIEATTDSAGDALVSVFSGTIPGPVKVKAELLGNAAVFAETQNLTIASGPPSQRFMSLSVETFNIEGWNRDGTNTRLTVRIADRQGNPVANGTVVNFTSEGGQVQSSCSTMIVDGISLCSVNFASQNNRPTDGRVTVLAYVAGTKDYLDVNLNNIFDGSIDVITNQGDAYRDDNENAAFDTGEFVIPRGALGSCPSSGGSVPSRADTCDLGIATTVRQQTVIMFSSSSPSLVEQLVSLGEIRFTLGSTHNPKLPMPAGTAVSGAAVDNTPTNELNCAVQRVLGTPIANIPSGFDPTASLRTTHALLLKDCASGDLITADVRSPSGLVTSYQWRL
jgi:hypothetical protein